MFQQNEVQLKTKQNKIKKNKEKITTGRDAKLLS